MSFNGSKTSCALMDPFLCFPFWNLMCFGGPKNLMFFDGPFPSWNLMCFDGPKNLMCFDGPTCVPPLRKPHVFWWTQKPHVFWWTLYLMWFDGPFGSTKTHECPKVHWFLLLKIFLMHWIIDHISHLHSLLNEWLRKQIAKFWYSNSFLSFKHQTLNPQNQI